MSMRINRCFLLLTMLALLFRPGYADAAKRCGQSGAKGGDDLLSVDLESLLNMKVITASKFTETLSDAPGIISVVSRDELRRFGGTTVREVLERVPGLTGTTAYFTDRSLVAARGDQTKINGGHILFLINGRPSREVLEGGLVSDVLESFPLAALDRIEVIKGPGSVLYGSNAFSAVINLITIKDARNGFSISGSPGASGARSTSGEGAYTCGGLSIFGAGQVHQRPDWSTPYRYEVPADPTAPAVPPAQTATIRDASTGAYVGATYKALSVTSSFTDWQTASFVRGTIGEPRWKRGFADVGYSAKASDRWNMTFDLTYTRNTFSISEHPFIRRDSNEVILEWTNFANPTDRDQLTFGALFNHVQGHEIFYGLGFPLPISDGRRAGSGAYAQLDHRLMHNVKLIGGFQANKIGELDLDIVPRAGVIWTPAARVNVKALYGKAFRAPSINETTLNHPGLVGNPNLLPEEVGTFDFELSYQGNRLQASGNYFNSRHTDSIVVDTSLPRLRYVNLGEATFRGVEFEGKYYVTKNVLVLGSLFHHTSENGDGVDHITPIADDAMKFGFSYQGPNGLTASLFEVYQDRIEGFGGTLNPDIAAGSLLSAHLRFDISRFLHSTGSKGVAFVLDGDNLTNRNLWLPDWGGSSGDTIPVSRGRTVFVGAEVSFNRNAAPPTRVARD